MDYESYKASTLAKKLGITVKEAKRLKINWQFDFTSFTRDDIIEIEETEIESEESDGRLIDNP